MIITRPCILYNLPKTRTTQRLKAGTKIKKIWNELDLFLKTCTTGDLNTFQRAKLTCYMPDESESHLTDAALDILLRSKKIMGEGDFVKPDNLPASMTWQVESEKLAAVIDFLDQGRPWPKLFFGPVELLISYNFKLVNPVDASVLRDQEYASSMMLWLGRNCSCSADIWFPFKEPSASFEAYLELIEQYLPFTLERKHLSRVYPNKDGTRHIFRKIK